MTITIESQTSTDKYCRPISEFAKRVFFPAVFTFSFMPRNSDGTMSCKEKLVEAEAAYHELQIGGATQYIHHEGRTQTFTPANRDELWKYILRLRVECGADSQQEQAHGGGCCCVSCAPSRGRAMGITW